MPPKSKYHGLSLYEQIMLCTELDPVTGCLLWTETTNPGGYGQIYVPKGTWRMHDPTGMLAHRVVYSMFAPIPEGLGLDHLCRVRRCVNPNHLEPVTLKVNILRGEGVMAQHARKTHCPKGHPYEGENLWFKPSANGGRGARRCRACKREENRLYRERKKREAQAQQQKP